MKKEFRFKCDRLDLLAGGRIEIRIAAGERVDVPKLHQLLRNEIDRRPQRIPVDLRKVHGAPAKLIEVLVATDRYAQSQNKILSVSYALPELQEALFPRRHLPDKCTADPESEETSEHSVDAGSIAKSILKTRLTEEPTYDLSHAKFITKKRLPLRRRRGFQTATASR